MSPHPLTARRAALAAAFIAAFTLHGAASAAVSSATCTVKADYSLNNSLVEPFSHTYTVTEGVAYAYDFSTTTRQKSLLSSIVRTGNRTSVSVNYFNDVGVFVAIEVDTSVPVQNVGQVGATSGVHTFYTSQGVVGNHATAWSVSCKGR